MLNNDCRISPRIYSKSFWETKLVYKTTSCLHSLVPPHTVVPVVVLLLVKLVNFAFCMLSMYLFQQFLTNYISFHPVFSLLNIFCISELTIKILVLKKYNVVYLFLPALTLKNNVWDTAVHMVYVMRYFHNLVYNRMDDGGFIGNKTLILGS